MFARKYGKKPSKEDIDDSSAEIKESYKRYSYLKKKKDENTDCETQNSSNLVPDDGVFGTSLNKTHNKTPPTKSTSYIKHDPDVSWRPKLKPLKRIGLSETQTLEKDCEKENEPTMGSILLVKNPSNNSDDVLCKTKERIPVVKSKGFVKKRLSSFGRNLSCDLLESCKQSLDEKSEKKNSLSNVINDDKNTPAAVVNSQADVSLKEITETSSVKENIEKVYTMEELCLDKHLDNKEGSQAMYHTNNLTNANSIMQDTQSAIDNEIQPPKKNNPTNSDEPVLKLNASKKKKKKLKKKDEEEETIVERVKRKREEESNAEEATSKKVKLSKKAAEKGKRLVSDNFVKIDLKKKTYQRGVKKLTGGAYKRRMWKKKTSFEVPTKNGSKCFKCGEEGHWAKFCRGKPKKVDPFKKLDEEMTSLEFQHLNEEQGSCFDYLNEDAQDERNNLLCSKKNFTLDDVMQIEPCWPRTPYRMEINDELFLPLFESEDGKPVKETYKKVKSNLKIFGHETFREGQHEAVARIVSGLSTLVILATGSGKSLCYQLPAYMYFKERKAMTIVVSPLVALMQDQVAGLPSCLPGAFLNSNMTKLQQQRVITKIKEQKIAVLLVSPEALVSGGFGTGILPPKSTLPPIAFACIDEAHCLSEWSHNFRPSYLRVCKVLRERYNIKCLLGLTATASQTTATSVIHHLGVPCEGSIIRDPNPIPPNLHITASRDENRDLALVELLQMKPFDECDSIIVYVTRRLEADRLAVMLRTCLPDPPPKEEKKEIEKEKKKKGKSRASTKPFWWNVECYHAGLTPAHRRRVQNQFMSGELRVVVATVAFGMGLDKSDVRSVIHFNMPKSFENYVQEIGRAGRDGKPSFCHVFLDDDWNDLNELRRHIYGNTVDRSIVKKFVDLVFPSCNCSELNEHHNSLTKDGDIPQVDSAPPLLDKEAEELFSQDNDDAMCTDIEMMGVARSISKAVEDHDDVIPSQKCCSGHRNALPIDSTVLELDMPQENISTLMSYLELHPRRWIEVLNPILSFASVKCYGGPEQFQLLAKKFPPVALSLRLLPRSELKYLADMKQIDLDFMTVADKMCWDVITVAREVRSLQWNMAFALDAPLNTTGKSGIIVECGQLSFHIVTREGIGDDEKDEICDFLHETVLAQEENRLLQLNALYNVLKDLSCQHFWELPSNKRIDEKARENIGRYFMYDNKKQLEILREMCSSDTSICTPPRRWNLIASDIRNLLISHPDEKFTGRAVARILQGINSPCYPAITFGRDRRFWRQCLDVDFNELRKFAVEEISRFRS